MPELPEVEVVRRSLSNLILGLKIKKVTIFSKKLRFKLSKNLKKNVENQKIISILLLAPRTSRTHLNFLIIFGNPFPMA